MAYMSQERKKEIQKEIMPLLKKYGLKGSLAVRHHSTLKLNVREGRIDFVGQANKLRVAEGYRAEDYVGIRHHFRAERWEGEALEFLRAAWDALGNGNHDNSDIQTDYFDVGWYVEINIGQWDRPYRLISEGAPA